MPLQRPPILGHKRSDGDQDRNDAGNPRAPRSSGDGMTKASGPVRARDRGRLAAPEVGLGNVNSGRWRSAAAHGGKGQQLLLGEARGDASTGEQPRTDRAGVFRESRHDETAGGAPTTGQVQDFAADNPPTVKDRRNGVDRLRPAELPMLLTAAQVEAALQLGRTRTYELLRSGEIPVRRVGRLIRVSRLALEEWVAQSEQASRQG
jgi:excisionase family DNA binding protein